MVSAASCLGCVGSGMVSAEWVLVHSSHLPKSIFSLAFLFLVIPFAGIVNVCRVYAYLFHFCSI